VRFAEGRRRGAVRLRVRRALFPLRDFDPTRRQNCGASFRIEARQGALVRGVSVSVKPPADEAAFDGVAPVPWLPSWERTPERFSMIDKNSVREYRYAREGEATLQTPLGPVQTVVYRAQKAYSPRVTRFWCAPERGYVPMKVEQTKDNDVQWTMQIQSLTRN
jgi:hypothetical protein